MSQKGCLLGLLGFLLLSFNAVAAQERDRSVRVCDFGEEGSGTVVGRLYAAGGDIDLSRGVSLWRSEDTEGFLSDARCYAFPSDEGSFEFRGVPQGRFRLGVAGLNLSPMTEIEFDVREGMRVRLDVPLFRENRLRECMNNPACAPVLSRRTAVEVDGTETQALLAVGYRLGIALAGEEWREGQDWVACVEDFETVGSGLVEAFPNIAAASECELRETQVEGISRPIMAQRHLASDRLARRIRVDGIENLSDDKATVTVSYMFALRWGQGHRCEVERRGGVWQPASCSMLWIS